MFLLEQNDVLENRSSDVDALSLSVSDASGLHDRERRGSGSVNVMRGIVGHGQMGFSVSALHKDHLFISLISF